MPDESLPGILALHFRRYPGLQVQDLVKLVYQNEFAGGHLIADASDSLRLLASETAALADADPDADPDAAPGGAGPGSSGHLFEDIGSGLCRLNLAVLRGTGASLPTVNRMMILTANENAGTCRGFRAKLEILRRCLDEGVLPLSAADLDAFLSAYDWQKCPPPGHSDRFRQLYKPAYRIVRSIYRGVFPVFAQIDALLRQNAPGEAPAGQEAGPGAAQGWKSVAVAIDGPCASGKSTLAALLQEIYTCPVVAMDHFFLPAGLKTAARLSEPGGNADIERFLREVAPGLKEGRPFSYRPFDCAVQAPGPLVTVHPGRLVVVEGSYSHHPALRDLYALKVFLQVDEHEQLRRLRARCSPALLSRFLSEWIPLENRYFQALSVSEHSDIVACLG